MSDCTQKRSTGERPVDWLLDGNLSPKELAEALAHIERCEDCAETKQIMEAAQSAWKDREDPVMPESLKDRIEDGIFAAIEADERIPQGSDRHDKEARRPRWGYIFSAVAAAAALVVGLHVIIDISMETDTLPTMGRDPVQTAKAPPAETGSGSPLSATVINISGGLASCERRGEAVKPVVPEQVLKDGEVLALGEGASLRLAMDDFAVVALKDGAIVELVSQDGSKGIALKRGFAALKVDSDKVGGVFKVATPAGDVEVHGTVFSVSVSASAQLTVGVVESTVTIRDSANPRNVIPVRSGQKIDVDWSAPKVSPMDSDLEKEIHRALSLTEGVDENAGVSENSTDKGRSRDREQNSPKNRSSAEELFAQATKARQSGDAHKAAELYQSIVESHAKRSLRAEAAFNLGQLYFTTSNFEAAEKVLSANRALLKGSSFADMSSFYLAKTRCRLGKYDDAVAVIDRVLSRSPNHPLAESMRKLKKTCAE